ncbi:ferrous iron transporter B [Candidatus Contubernalis alkaliaceticus]|uniref:ferrous iron transporter B n=1 Tax=Candidatus Contubernalis alkaliaceticus TaxID=338645 RepID=UPI001F4BE278|nr:ferrous iron transporter B [Candidatus Contubernalis alkalaceticus]UNC90715.1 ferrous iron transporter B [Candidatus Contubernalis alkalaceticus]
MNTGKSAKKKDGVILLVGRPNVGKSVIFNRITDSYAVVSNYPGTTVDITSGKLRCNKRILRVKDTPGIYSLTPFTQEEKVTVSLLKEQKADLVLHVVDAKNLDKMLSLTFQLMEAGHPLVLVVNMLDEAREVGLVLNLKKLEEILKIPVIGTVSIKGQGIEQLKKIICKELNSNKRNQKTVFKSSYPGELQRQRAAREVVKEVSSSQKKRPQILGDRLSLLTMHPFWGLCFLALVLYYGLYKFVGMFGAGALVDFMDGYLYQQLVMPWLIRQGHCIPFFWLEQFLYAEYGLFNLGLRYSMAVVLPIVTSFFIFFSVVEDSGYLPRLAMLLDRLFKKFGLNGRSVIPLILGLGCGTMAVMAARTLETKRERFICVLLLALGIPCSAQLGLILSILAGQPRALAVWAVSLLLILGMTGYLLDKILPGTNPHFYMEIPPLRIPHGKALFNKTFARIKWYMKEVIPLFFLVSVIMWVGAMSGLLDYVILLLAPLLRVMNLPEEMAPIFILGFFRRDYGAAGLYDLVKIGTLSTSQLVAASLTLSLFLPCIAQFIMVIKEQGLFRGMVILVSVLFAAFGAGYLLSRILNIVPLL